MSPEHLARDRPVTVFELASFAAFRPAAAVRRLAAFSDLLWTLSAHRLSVRYRQTRLGILRAVLQPLAVMLAFALVFALLGNAPSDGIPYALFAFAALVPWTALASGLASATTALTGHAALLTKVAFPREILPITYAVAAIADAALASVVLAALMAWYGVALTLGVVLVRHVRPARLCRVSPPQAGHPARRRSAGSGRRGVPGQVPAAHWRASAAGRHPHLHLARPLCGPATVRHRAAPRGRACRHGGGSRGGVALYHRHIVGAQKAKDLRDGDLRGAEVSITHLTLHDADGAGRVVFDSGTPARIRVQWTAAQTRANVEFDVSIHAPDGRTPVATLSGAVDLQQRRTGALEFDIPALALQPGTYYVSAVVRDAATRAPLDWWDGGPTLHIQPAAQRSAVGPVALPYRVRLLGVDVLSRR